MTNPLFGTGDDSQEMILDTSETINVGLQGKDAVKTLSELVDAMSVKADIGGLKYRSADNEKQTKAGAGTEAKSAPGNLQPTFCQELFDKQQEHKRQMQLQQQQLRALSGALPMPQAPPTASLPAHGKPSVTGHTGSGLYKSGAPSTLASRPAGAGLSKPPFQSTVRATAPTTNRPTIRQATPMPLFRAPASTPSVRSTAPSNFIRPPVPSTSRPTVQPITSASPGPSTPHQPAAPTPANQPAGGQALGLTTNRPTAAETAISR